MLFATKLWEELIMDILPGKKLTRVDPVCGLEIMPTKSNPFEVVKGHTYYFCTEKCRRTFNNEPTTVPLRF